MFEDLLHLLAMRHAFGERRAALASALLDAGAAVPLSENPQWMVGSDHLHTARKQLQILRAMGIRCVPVWNLPERMRNRQPPPVLFVRGDATLLHAPAVGLVGSRRASESATRWSHERAREVAAAGAVVVSGGAQGVDAAAHRGALEAGGRTVAYLGVAADEIFPRFHRSLFGRILQRGGAIMSEFAPGEGTKGWAHARRNRFIAAHSACLLVVEAATKSGTLGTVEHARRLGVPVYVSPPHVGQMREGLEQLIADGQATVLDSFAPIGAALGRA